ncbi:hypothetical protein V3F56_13180 [Moorellaceae bacterium AZ2]
MNITVALRQMAEPGAELKSLFEVLSQKLEAKGVHVILLPAKAGDGILLQLWEVQVAFAFTQIGKVDGGNSVDRSLCFYPSSNKRRKESLAIIAAIVREMLLSKEIISYSLARRWDHLKQFRYYSFLKNTEVPVVLIELRHFPLTQEKIERLTSWIVNGLNYYYGQMETQEAEESKPDCQLANGGHQSLAAEQEEPLGECSLPEEKAEEKTAAQSEGEELETMEEETEEKTEAALSQQAKLDSGETPTVKNDNLKVAIPAAPNTGTVNVRVAGKRRYWGGNPLAPPGDGPIYFFERRGTPELPPAIHQLRMQLASFDANQGLVKNIEQTRKLMLLFQSKTWYGGKTVVNPAKITNLEGEEVDTPPADVLSELKELVSALPPQRESQFTENESNKAPS